MSLRRSQIGAFFSRSAGGALARRLIGRRLEMDIAQAAVAALANDDDLADFREIVDHGFLIVVKDLGAVGTLTVADFPFAPWRSLPMPWWPRSALKCCR